MAEDSRMKQKSRPARSLLRRCTWGLVVIASILSLYLLSCALVRSPLFVVKCVEVEASQRPGEEEVRSLSGIRPGMNLLSVDTEEVSRRLETHPWIHHATVVKRPPADVLIKVWQRRPAALTRVGGRLYYLDAEGGFLGETEPGAALDFPMITGLEQDAEDLYRSGKGRDVQQALALLRVLQAIPALGRVSEIDVDGSEGLRFVLERFPVPVQVGWTDFSNKMHLFEKALPSLVSQADEIESVDLRFSCQIIVREGGGGEPRIPVGVGTRIQRGSGSWFHPTT